MIADKFTATISVLIISILSAQAFQLHPNSHLRVGSHFGSPSSSPSRSILARSIHEQQQFQHKKSTSLNTFDMGETLGDIETFYKTAPYTAAFMTCGIKASAADFLAQFRERTSDDKTKEQVELERNVAFILYGGIYQGMAQYYIYNVLFPLWFGTGQDFLSVTTKVAFDLIVISPFLCLPIAYLTKAVIYGTSLSDGLNKYINDLKYEGLLQSYYSIWLPVQFCTFGLVPEHLRIAFIAMVSFFWLIILSTISSRGVQEEPEETY